MPSSLEIVLVIKIVIKIEAYIADSFVLSFGQEYWLDITCDLVPHTSSFMSKISPLFHNMWF